MTEREDEMKDKLIEYTGYVVAIIYIVAWFWILTASKNCPEVGSILEAQGVCL